MNAERIEVNCYNCGSNRRGPYAEENGFTLVKCAACGLLYVNPRPSLEEMVRAHQFGVHQGEIELDVTGTFSEDKLASYRRKLADLFGADLSGRGRRWLDIGCGHGEFITALQRFSGGLVEARGLEPNVRKQESARGRGLDVGCFDLEDHGERYDAVSLLNVFSHLPDPPAFLATCRGLLEPGGELLLETGDTAGLPAEAHPRPFQLPDHLSFASEAIVAEILDRTGFRVTAVRKYPTYPFKYSAGGVLARLARATWPEKITRLRELAAQYRRSRACATDMYLRAAAA